MLPEVGPCLVLALRISNQTADKSIVMGSTLLYGAMAVNERLDGSRGAMRY